MQTRRAFFENLGKGSVVAASSAGLLPAIFASEPAVAGELPAVAAPAALRIPAGGAAAGFSDYRRSQVGEDIVIYASELGLEMALVSPIHNLLVYADTVTLKEDIRLSGRRIFVHARELHLNGKTLDVSGRAGEEYDAVAAGIANMSTAGPNGAAGRPGSDAGQIIIVAEAAVGQGQLRANGGAGGRGQQGGAGGQGLPGAPGRDAECPGNQEGTYVGQQGQAGGKGGAGGTGGTGGDGGRAGIIKAFLLRQLTQGDVSLEQKGGIGNQAGMGGTLGLGGAGGTGGRNKESSALPSYREADRYSCKFGNGRGPTGPIGPSGDIPPPRASGASKPDQPTEGGLIACDYTLLANSASITQLALTLHNTSLHYVNNDFDNCATLLAWLLHLTASRATGPVAAGGAIPMAFASVPVEVKPEEWQALGSRVQVLVAQMQAGLDYYGYPRNYVPLLSLDEYRDNLPVMFELAQAIEASHDKYWLASQNDIARLAGIDETLATTANIVRNLGQQKGSLGSRTAIVKKTVNELDVTILRLAVELEQAEEQFKKAIKKQAGDRCPVGSILKLVAAIVVTVETGGAAAPAIAASVSALEAANKFKDIVKQVKEIAAKIGEVQQSIVKLQQAYSEFKQDIDQSLAATKLTMNSTEFNEMFGKFKDLPEARTYRKRIENYQSACNTRNEKLFEYTALVIKLETLNAEIDLQATQADRLRSVRAQTTDPNLLEWEVYMQTQLARAKELLVRAIYETSRAYEYWALEPANFGKINDLNVAALKARFLEFVARQQEVKQAQGRNEQPFDNIKLTLNELDMSKHYDAASGQLDITFAISPDMGAFGENLGWRKVLVRNVKINLVGLSVKGLKIDLIHGGSVQINSDRPHYFSHQPRPTSIAYDANGTPEAGLDGNNLGGSEKNSGTKTYVDLSPFTFWKMKVRNGSPIQPSKIKRVELTFSGLFVPTV